MKLLHLIVVLGFACYMAEADGQGHGGGRRGRVGRRRNRPRGGRQQQFDLGPPPQPVINIPEPVAAPLPVQAASPNRFVPSGPAPGSAFPPESPVRGRIPDRDGNYDFEFETDEGEFRHEEGTQTGKIGEFSWTSPEGELVSFTYQADENGYQAQGSHLPQAPPLHPHIQRGLELIARVNQRNANKRN